MAEVVELGNLAVYEVDLYLEGDTPFVTVTLDGHEMCFSSEVWAQISEAGFYLLDKYRNSLN